MDKLDRKPGGRLALIARKPDTEVSRHGVIVRIEANARAYEFDVSQMRQRSIQTGRRRRVLCRGGRWFYDASKGSNGARRSHVDRSHWEPYAEDVQRLLELAVQQQQQQQQQGAAIAPPRRATGNAEDGFDLGATARALQRQSTPVVVDDVRRAALIFGSMWLLRIVFLRADLRLVGQPIYDRQYPKIGAGLSSEQHKACIRALLSRGMVLGKAAPHSKLLRKIEVDALVAWERPAGALMPSPPTSICRTRSARVFRNTQVPRRTAGCGAFWSRGNTPKCELCIARAFNERPRLPPPLSLDLPRARLVKLPAQKSPTNSASSCDRMSHFAMFSPEGTMMTAAAIADVVLSLSPVAGGSP